MKPNLCLDSTCIGGEHCAACIKRNIIALEGYTLMQVIERVPASVEQTAAVTAAELFITIAENAALINAERTATANNSQSDAIAALQKEVQWLKEVVGQHQSFVGLHTKLGGNSAR